MLLSMYKIRGGLWWLGIRTIYINIKGQEIWNNYFHTWIELKKNEIATATVSVLIRTKWINWIQNWEETNERILEVTFKIIS